MRKRHVALIVLSCLLLLLASCASPRRDEPLTIGVRTANDHAPFYIADQQQLYKERGLDITVRLVPSNTEIIEAMQRGDFQVGVVPVTTAISAIARGSPMHIVAMTGRGSDGILVRRADGIADVQGLRGKRIVTIRTSILDVLLRHALERVGLDPDKDVELVYMNTLGDMIAALQTGQVDAASHTEPFMTDAEYREWGRVVSYYTADWPDHPCCVVVARDSFIEGDPQALRDILSVHCQTVDWANAHVPETAQIIVDYLQSFEPPVVAASLDPARMRIDYALQAEEIERMAGLMQEQGLIDQVPASERLVDLDPLQDVLEKR